MTYALNLGCGSDYHEDAHNVDVVDSFRIDEQYDITEYPWPWQNVDEIRMYHVLEHLPDMARALDEASRILNRKGTVKVKLPMGRDAYADNTHLWGKRGIPWTWRTPEFCCGKRAWSNDIDLEIVNREVALWSVAPTKAQKAYHQLKWDLLLRRYGPGEWCFGLPQSCGEFTIHFEKP